MENSATTSNSATVSNSAKASNMVATNTPSSSNKCKRWEPPCPFCVHSAPHPSPVDSPWSEEDWDGDREEENRNKEKRKMLQRQAEQKKVLSSNYYPPELMYIPNHEDHPPTVANNLTPAPENTNEVQQDRRGTKTEEDRRIII